MNNRYFEPLIEGALLANNGHPIFAKALTYGTRVVRLPRGFVDQSDHLQEARNLVIDHHRTYENLSLARMFPIQYYAYFTSPKQSIRISTAGRVIGIFQDVPANPSFGITTADGKKRIYEIVDE